MQHLPELPSPDSMATALRKELIDASPPPFGRIDWVTQTGSTNADLLARVRERGGVRNGGGYGNSGGNDPYLGDDAGGVLRSTSESGRDVETLPGRGIGTRTGSGTGAGSGFGSGLKPWLLGTHLQQTGRGRAGRSWHNRRGAALMFSCAFDTSLAPSSLPVLSPLAGLAAVEALRAVIGSEGGERLRVKWPNDVQWDDAKLAGVLVETTRNLGTRPASHTVVIGMGMNLRDGEMLSRALDRDIADWSATGCRAALSDVVRQVALAWRDALLNVELGGFEAFVDRFRRLDALAGRNIQVLDRGEVLHRGIACGADTQGRLLVRTEAGEVPISVGEVSVRPA